MPPDSAADSRAPEYGNWVSRRLVYVPAAVGIALLALALPVPLLVLPAALFLLTAGYFAYARRAFAATGGDVQTKIRGLLLDQLAWKGEGTALDIGCGSGAMVIALAQKHPDARITGIDHWDSGWEYSKSVCERNAEIMGVRRQVVFEEASASALPFPDGTFDAVVSNLTFHEVRDAADKRAVVHEALRVLKKGGPFAFQDLFQLKRVYGDPDELVRTVQGWGTQHVEFISTRDAPFIPRPLRLPFMVGTLGILKGTK